MAEVFRKFGFVFFFYSNEGQEPVHIHVRKAEKLIFNHLDLIKSKWHEVFGS